MFKVIIKTNFTNETPIVNTGNGHNLLWPKPTLAQPTLANLGL